MKSRANLPRTLKLLVSILSWSLLVGGFSPVRALDTRLWLAPTGGYSTYEMTEVNDQIRFLNRIYRPQFQLDEISSGPSLGIAFGADFGTCWYAAVGYQRLWASSEGDSIEYQLSAHVLGASVGYKFHVTPSFLLGPSVGAGVLMLSDAHIDVPRLDLDSANTADFEGSLDFQYRASDRLNLLLQGGYRYAKVEDVESGAFVIHASPSGTPLDVDYSGEFVKLGVMIYVLQ